MDGIQIPSCAGDCPVVSGSRIVRQMPGPGLPASRKGGGAGRLSAVKFSPLSAAQELMESRRGSVVMVYRNLGGRLLTTKGTKYTKEGF